MPMVVCAMQIFISPRGPLRGSECIVPRALLGFRTGVRSVIFALLDLLRMESSGSKARRGAAWVWPKGGWPAQHGARERREVSFLIFSRGPRGYPGGSKKSTPKIAMDPKRSRSRCTPKGRASPGALGKFFVFVCLSFER
jgi:hypothetical protein